MLYSRPLLVNCFIYNSYVNPNFPTYSSPVLPPDNHTFVFYVSNSIYVSLISSFIAFFLIFKIPHISDSIFLSLADFTHYDSL